MAGPEKPRRVLIVDDDEVLRQVLAIGLEDAGYETLQAENGARAIPVIAESRPDVLLVDMLMPVMDGLELLRWVKEKAKLEVPSLVVTCLDARSVLVDCLVAGAADVLTKPFPLEVLLRKLSTLA